MYIELAMAYILGVILGLFWLTNPNIFLIKRR